LNGRILEGALGYYLNPFFNMLFGFLWFGERHNRLQLVAIALALSGVALQIPAVGRFPWVALTLALTFSLYAVVKKRAPLGARLGLTAETCLLAPLAFVWLLLACKTPAAAFGGNASHALLVMGSGLATTLPLVFFGYAARTIRLTTLGILQFLGPTLQFFIGWKLYGEPMTGPRLLAFALIWLAVAIYAADAGWGGKSRGGKMEE
jgi:chloramphenicol-sensitive protein RarD